MIRDLWSKIKEAVISILPVTLMIILLSFTPLYDLKGSELLTFIISAIVLMLGIGLFSLGADIAMQPMGETVGSSLIKTKKLPLIIVITLILGILVTVAEPDLTVIAKQIGVAVNTNLTVGQWMLIITIGVGVGIFLVLAILKIIFNKDLTMLLMFGYLFLFAVTCILLVRKPEYLGMTFDLGGVTTGPLSGPFIMAMGLGVATVIGGRNAKENSFGLVALCSVGPIIFAILLVSVVKGGELSNLLSGYGYHLDSHIIEKLAENAGTVLLSVILIFGAFLLLNILFIKLPRVKILKFLIGILYTFAGVTLFLTAAEIGFLPTGYKIGSQLANKEAALIIFGFVIGFVVVLAEPTLHVLTKQVEEVTTGAIKKKTMLIALCIGIGIAICLSMIKIVFGFSVLWFLIPGYLVSFALSFFVPKLYTGVAFDAGAVASGPLTSTFIVPMAIGVCSIVYDTNVDIIRQGYGIVAMVAMTPLITIQILGFKSVIQKQLTAKRRLKAIESTEHDDQIIEFM
ncbi:MAG: DUF1538 domain-containing protein [Acholeplasmatales bacterium]|nr:DUF1538 domain-containing protein [Acholeplasmatales bacterium]